MTCTKRIPTDTHDYKPDFTHNKSEFCVIGMTQKETILSKYPGIGQKRHFFSAKSP